MDIRLETVGDWEGIARVNELAFGRRAEADLVEKLRNRGALTLSLVALDAGTVVGHVAFSPVAVVAAPKVKGIGLGPLAVLPGHQRRGIGARLVRDGLERCRQLGFALVVVFGSPAYYRRFGFVPARTYALRCEYDATPDTFQVLELVPNALAGLMGLVKYQPEFDEV